MLSIKNVGLEQASTYYVKDNYYTKQQGEFWGKSLHNLGFTPELTHSNFINMLSGKNVDGKNLKRAKQSGQDRAGLDLTFSAPKGVSILTELADAKGNTQLAKALRTVHDNAVNATLAHIENTQIQTRIRENGKRVERATGNMVVAKFVHDTSRELDEQLHTHCVLGNLTQLPNGQWQSISNEILYDNKIANGLFYRSELAVQLKKIGIEVEIINEQLGLIDIVNIDQALYDEFSTRSAQIQELLPKMREQYPNASEAKLKQYAATESRKAKKDINRDDVYQVNLKRAEKIVDVDALLNTFTQKMQQNQDNNTLPQTQEQIDEYTNSIVLKAAQILNENESTFEISKLRSVALKLGLGKVGPQEVENAIQKCDQLVAFSEKELTTKEMMRIEGEIVQFCSSEQGKKERLMPAGEIKDIDSFTKGQNDAFKHILQSEDTIIGIQGDAGTGKTYMLKHIKEALAGQNVELIGLAYTGKAAQGLESESGIQSSTLHSFLYSSSSKKEEESKTTQKVYIVDEASMVGSKQLHQLISKASAENARIVLIGDTKQFQSISAGAIFDQLQQRGMSTVTMDESLRQKTKELKEVVSYIKNKQYGDAFSILKTQKMVEETQDLVQKALEEYRADSNSLIITSLNELRKEVNDKIRDFRVENKEIEEGFAFKTRSTVNRQTEEKHFTSAYKKDNIVFFNGSAAGIKAGSEAKVIDINSSSNHITLQFEDGQSKDVDISQIGDKLSIFEEVEKHFSQGEKILFTKNDKRLGVQNGDLGVVKKIDKNGNIEVEIDKKTVNISLKNYAYIDHGYCTTDYKAQGATADNCVVIAPSKMANQKSFYTQITRAKFRAKVYTDNLNLFTKNVDRDKPKTTTLEKLNDLKNSLKTAIQTIKQTSVKQVQNVLQKIKNKNEISKENLHDKYRNHAITRDQKPERNLASTSRNDGTIDGGNHQKVNTPTRGSQLSRTEPARDDGRGASRATSYKKQNTLESELER